MSEHDEATGLRPRSNLRARHRGVSPRATPPVGGAVGRLRGQCRRASVAGKWGS
jgi:hypothetical protein